MHARSLPNIIVQTSPKPLSSCDASSTALSRFQPLIHNAYDVCVSTQAADVCVSTQDQATSSAPKQPVVLETSSSNHPIKGVLLAPLISPSAASSWRPPGPCKLTSLLFNPTSWQPPGSCKLTSLRSKSANWQPPEPGELACLLFQPVSGQPPGSCKLTSLLSKPTSWQPPGSRKLTSLLFRPTNDTHTSGQAVFEKDKLFITPESSGVSAHAGLRDSSEHARAWVSFKEGVG